jgi:crotonobetainyl-CoA:carnitine CoA-transferase CaiB-like acyl-CoA transferase
MKLEGVRVLDLSLFLPGPHLTMMMADHGADVIKVENPEGGEPTRHIGYRKAGQSVWFRNTHRGKRSLALNLKAPEGREILMQIAERSDVLLESFRPGVAERLGIGPAAVRARAPRLVYCSISAFGQTGMRRDDPAHDLSIQALAGIVSLNLDEQNQPVMPHMPVADLMGSLMAFGGILMALLRRERTGLGDYLDVSMQDSILSWLVNVTGPVFAEQRAPVPRHERSFGGAAFFRIYRTRDGQHVTLGGSEMKFARNLLTALQRPDLIPLCELPPGPGQDPVKAFLAETFLQKTRAEWIEWFHGRDVCFAPVLDLKEAFEDPQVAQRAMLLHDEEGLEHIGVPIRYEDEPARPRLALPALGQHTAEILAELGYDAAQIAALEARGVCKGASA